MHPSLKPLAAATAALVLAACAGSPKSPPPEVVRLQDELSRITGDTRIPPYAGPEIEEARRAVDSLVVEGRRMEDEVFDHNVYIADRLIKVAEAEGLAGYAEASTKALARERETLQLDARTREADNATARAEAERRAAEMARADALSARAELEAMQARLSELQAKQTERGLVVTLGDVLFEVDRAELKPGALRSLDELIAVLRENPTSTVAIEGHTDSTGSRDHNLSLSQRRADAVRSFLVGQGVEGTRITSRGMGPDYPVASNGDAAGRQQNRRVELVIQDRPLP